MLRRLTAGGIALACVALAALTGAPGDSRSAGNRAAYPDTFPAGPGREIAERACLFCHSPMLVTQQAKDSTGWEKSLATMEKWGAPMTPAERDTLRGYLLARFGPRTPATK
jgi:cytochrome c5